MMYQVSVPISMSNIDRMDRATLLERLREMDAVRVMLAIGVYETHTEARACQMESLRSWTSFFHENGFEVGTWCWTFWAEPPHSYTPMRCVNKEKTEIAHTVCPTDPNFVKFVTDYLADVAACGVDLILFDDDFRFSVLEGGNIGCLCDRHVAMIERRTGEKLTHDALVDKILSGGKNKFRDAWIASNGEAFETFAKAVRARVDSVSLRVRVGFCACFSAWDIDGTTADQLAHLLAGPNTKPLVRLIGAPYWGSRNQWGCFLQDVIELERMESAWTRDGEIEILAEGDCYPRPRFHCPAAYLEGFDLAIRAAGVTDGILKYVFDYVSGLDYERGYVEAHKRNKPLYESMDDFFAGKDAVGVRVYEFTKKAAMSDFGEEPVAPRSISMSLFSSSARTLSSCCIPTTYEGEGICGAVFGQNAQFVTPEMRRNGLILDAVAARILHQKGVDVGIRSFGNTYVSAIEHFIDPEEYAPSEGMQIFDHTFSEKIRVCSEARVSDRAGGLSHMEVNGETAKTVPVSYLYENDDGERYLVLNFDAFYCDRKTPAPIILRHYARSRQYAEAVKWLSNGKTLPAYCYGNPHLYTMAKRDEDSMTVGLWNFFVDPVTAPVVTLDREYKKIRFLNCEGTMTGNTVTLSELSPFGFAAFEVEA